MDKYEYTIKSDKIKKLVESKDYETAVKIADTIDWERVRNMKMLSTVSLAYEKVARFEEAKDLLLMAYECAPVGRRFLYKLTELAVKQGSYEEAEDYLKEFTATSPQDPSRLILRYEISKAKDEPTERLITILEAYQKREFEERWSYELASLYYKVGKNEECVKLCDEIVLWFGVGPYVDKAMELKQRIAPLTPDQIEKRENKEKYQRRLEEVQREFEEKYRVLEETSKKAIEEAVQASREQAAAAEVVEPVVDETVALAAAEAERLQAEMEADLAREIETAAMAAALNEAMLRETAATMETIGAVENDHSQEREQTKVAPARIVELTKTKEFVRQAKAICATMEEVQDRPVTAEEVEAKLEELKEEIPLAVAEESVVEEAPIVVEAPAAVEETSVIVEEPAAVEETPVVVEEPAAVEEAPTVVEEKAPAVHKSARDHYVLVASAQEEDGLKECVAYIRRMRELLGYPVTQVAKIKGAKLATKDMAQTLRKLQGRDLIVCGIADLPDAMLAQTIDLMAGDNVKSFIALIDTEAEIAALQSRMDFFADCRVLSCAVDIPVVVPEEKPMVEKQALPVATPSVKAEPVSEEVAQEKEEPVKGSLADLVEEALRAGVLEMMANESGKDETVEPAKDVAKATAEEPVVASASDDTAEAAEAAVEEGTPIGSQKKIASAELTPKEFYECAIRHAEMMDAIVDEMGGLAIYAAAEEYQQEREPLTEELAQELIENAVVRAERRTLKSLFSNRYNKEGYLILKEQHFKE